MVATYKIIDSATVGSGGAASIIFNNIPQTYTDLVIKLSSRRSTAGIGGVLIYSFNAGATPIYNGIRLYGSGSAVFSSTQNNLGFGSFGELTGSGATANTFASAETYIANYSNQTSQKAIGTMATGENNAQEAYAQFFATNYPELPPITKITITPGAGSISEFTTATLYGIFNKDVSSAPSTPTIGTATADNRGGASVTFTGVSGAASYTVTASAGGFTGTGTASPITVSGLTAGTSYTFTVTASNPLGTSGASAASNSITAQNTTLVGIGNATSGNYSTNGGSSWTGFTLPVTSGANVDATGEYLCYGQNKFIYVPYNQANLYYSSTGYSSWTSVAIPGGTYNGAAIGYVPNVGFLSVSMYSSQRTINSTNGTSWSAGATATNVGIALGYVNGTWYTAAHNDTYGYYSTNLGTSWTANASWSPAPYFGTFGFGASNGVTSVFTGQYGSSNTLWYTTTGTTVTAGTMPSTANWYGSQCYGFEAGIFVAGDGATSASSTDGTTWTARTGIANTGRLTVYAADIGFVRLPANTTSNSIATSTDGITWTLKASGVTLNNFWTLASAQVVNYSKSVT